MPGKAAHRRHLLARKGWRVVGVRPDLESYRNYIESSKAEWSIANKGCVLAGPGGSVVDRHAT